MKVHYQRDLLLAAVKAAHERLHDEISRMTQSDGSLSLPDVADKLEEIEEMLKEAINDVSIP